MTAFAGLPAHTYDSLLPVVLGVIVTVGAIVWAVAAVTTRRRWQFLGSVLCALLAGVYWVEAFGADGGLGVRMVRTIGVAWLGFAAVWVPLWIVKVTRKRDRQLHQVVGEIHARTEDG